MKMMKRFSLLVLQVEGKQNCLVQRILIEPSASACGVNVLEQEKLVIFYQGGDDIGSSIHAGISGLFVNS